MRRDKNRTVFNNTRPRSSRVFHRLMTLVTLMILLASVFTLPGASAQDDTHMSLDTLHAVESIAELPEPSPTPTLVPTAPEPTPVHTPVPTEPSNPEPTASPLPTTPTPEPTDAPVATPTRGLRSSSVQLVVLGTQCTLNGTEGIQDVVGFVHGHHSTATFDCPPLVYPGGTVGISAPTLGWQYQIVGPVGVSDKMRIGPFDDQHFDILGNYVIRLGPVDANTKGVGRVMVFVTVNGVTSSTTLEARTPDTELAQCADIATTPVTASLVDGMLLPIPFSLEPRTVTAGLAIAVDNPQQCEGWVVDVSATDFIYTGPGQGALPASSLRVVRRGMEPFPLSNTVQRLVSNGGGGLSYEYPMELVIPGGTAVGTYTGTVTLSTVAAPGS